MKNEYKYYLKEIKPLEKKYTKICYYYEIFKFQFLKNKKMSYNNLLRFYYKTLKSNDKKFNSFIKSIKLF